MARSRLCRICSDWHDVSQAWPEACIGHFGTMPHASAPYVISDTMDPIRSMVSGRMHDSKSRYRTEVHAAGCRIVGNDRLDRSTTPLPPIAPDIKRAVAELSSR